MNRDFLESLQTSIAPAPEMPSVVLRALAARRIKRRVTRAAVSSAAVLTLASVVLVMRGIGPAQPGGVGGGVGGGVRGGAGGGSGEGTGSAPIAEAPSPVDSDWPARLPEHGTLTIASLYTRGSVSGHEPDGASGTDQVLRIGDQWDFDRVTEWVLK